jgi:hypothetical protein
VLVKSQSGGVGEDAFLAVVIDYDVDKKKHDYDIILKRIMMTMRKRRCFLLSEVESVEAFSLDSL